MPNNKNKDHIIHTQLKAVPILHEGNDDLTPRDIEAWEYYAANYLSANGDKVSAMTVISMLTTGFQDHLVCNWFDVNHIDLLKLSIAEFTNSMRETFLNEQWSRELCSSILASAQPSTESITQWTNHLHKDATLLSKTPQAVSDECLMDLFKTNMSSCLLTAYKNDEDMKKVWDLNDIKKWVASAQRSENRMLAHHKEIEEISKK
ncbi:hypothetical protein EDD18DRAFT_1111142 [Armillaria luteobubalina]|uniref:Uncharacterized protein n=1 Tax=Armillaria luteobubalina TaxID=153913 RepID=A0AA39PLV8_9AGAR|nr:hypothetical protein EDD18DRAFT_1111142 [Armillaria luteobubalina]